MSGQTLLYELSQLTKTQEMSYYYVYARVREILAIPSDAVLMELLLFAFKSRDVRGGDGKRQFFYYMIGTIYEKYPDLIATILHLIPHYGSWKDLLMLVPYVPRSLIYKVMATQLEEDEKRLPFGGPVSFLAKWAPREGKQFSHLAKDFAYYLAGKTNAKHSQIMATYRKRMSRINLAMRTVETLECDDRWDEINPARVPMRAMKIKMDAYTNKKKDGSLRKPHDIKRNICRQNFIYWLETTPQPSFYAEEDRWGLLRTMVADWIQGGWRGT